MPVTMIAAFAKRMSRLSLTAPPSGCLFISAVVFNLIRRHPTLLPLIHQTNKRKRDDDESEQPATKVQNIGDDVFDMSQTDPTKARAMESSLWELKTLQNHYIWAVASQAKLFEAENAPKSDMDVEPLVEKSYHSLMQEEIERKADAKPALAVHKPTSLIGASFDAWDI
jgi:U3 small nucleolar RNA-associated protein 19